MKAKLRYENVTKRRDIRNPIDRDRIEEIRNEGWEFIGSFGDIEGAMRNPNIAPIIAVFRQDEAIVEAIPAPKPKPIVKAVKKTGRFAKAADKAMSK